MATGSAPWDAFPAGVSGADAEQLSQDVASLYQQAELRIIQRLSKLAKRLDGLKLPDFLPLKLAELHKASQQSIAELAQIDQQAAQQLQQQLDDAYAETGLTAYQNLSEVGMKAAMPLPAARKAAVKDILQDTMNAVQSMKAPILRSVPDLIQQLTQPEVANAVATGTGGESIQSLVDNLFAGGMRVIPTARGKMNIADYAKMAIRTGMAKALIQGHADVLSYNGHNLVIIHPGPRPCEICDHWARSILSLDGTTGEVEVQSLTDGTTDSVFVEASLQTARDNGWNHPNCRCSVGGFFPGVTDPLVIQRPPWDKYGYDASQHQRQIEAQIRKWKYRQASSLDDSVSKYASGKVAEWQKVQRDWITDNPFLKRQSAREQLILSVAQRADAQKNVLSRAFVTSSTKYAPKRYSGFVNEYTTADVKGMKAIHLANGGKTGLLVHDHGDGDVEMTGLFNGSGIKGGIGPLINQAINEDGVNYAECYGDHLRETYERYGFKVAEKYDFDPTMADSRWNSAKFDSPSYYIMKLVK